MKPTRYHLHLDAFREMEGDSEKFNNSVYEAQKIRASWSTKELFHDFLQSEELVNAYFTNPEIPDNELVEYTYDHVVSMYASASVLRER